MIMIIQITQLHNTLFHSFTAFAFAGILHSSVILEDILEEDVYAHKGSKEEQKT